MGSLKKIRVETSASGSRQSWFLERVCTNIPNSYHYLLKIKLDNFHEFRELVYLITVVAPFQHELTVFEGVWVLHI